MCFAGRTNAYGIVDFVVVKDAFFTVKCLRFRTMNAVNAVVFFEAASARRLNEAEHL
jgi:hypothetical protein